MNPTVFCPIFTQTLGWNQPKLCCFEPSVFRVKEEAAESDSSINRSMIWREAHSNHWDNPENKLSVRDVRLSSALRLFTGVRQQSAYGLIAEKKLIQRVELLETRDVSAILILQGHTFHSWVTRGDSRGVDVTVTSFWWRPDVLWVARPGIQRTLHTESSHVHFYSALYNTEGFQAALQW